MNTSLSSNINTAVALSIKRRIKDSQFFIAVYRTKENFINFSMSCNLNISIVFSIVFIVLLQPAFAAEEEYYSSVPNPRLILPEVIYVVPGIESNIYFDNIVIAANRSNYIFDVTCDKGLQQSERWTYTASEKETGEYPLTIDILDQANRSVANANTTVKILPVNAGSGNDITLLMIGDSLTHSSVYSQHLLDLCANETNPRLTLIGSHGPGGIPGTNRHEGYGGWTAKRFATYYDENASKEDYKKRSSPFLYKKDGGIKLDFGRYCDEFNNSKAPDLVTIFLGANDIFSASDITIESQIDEMLVYYDMLIAMIHEFGKDTKIGVLLPVPPGASQDAFGANYACGQTQWQYKRNQHRLVERLIRQYGSRTNEKIYIVPTYINLDCFHNYPVNSTLCNSRTSTQMIRLNNGVHPAESGYRQIGDSVYCWLKAIVNDLKN